MATEDKFPTIRDLRDALTLLCNLGLGELATQVTVVPASTIIAVARITGPKQMAAHGDRGRVMEREKSETEIESVRETVEARMLDVFMDWWADNARYLEAGLPADFVRLRDALNAACANSSSSAEVAPRSSRNCLPAA